MDDVRIKKAERLQAKGILPYASRFERSHSLAQARALPDGSGVHIAGRIVLLRDMGKLTFLTLQDHSGRLQIALREEAIGEKAYKDALESLDLGDFIGVSGERFATKTGEPSVMAKTWTMLSKSLLPLPEKWHGIADQETAWRKRYLDLVSHREVYDRFVFRSRFVQRLREFYWSRGFLEMETPVLTNAASGALAAPFTTHHNAYDLDVYLRIAPETYLKECLVGGFDRVFEVARCFRNEGLDPSHLQDFTMVEHYAAYWDFTDNMRFTEELLSTVLKDIFGKTSVEIPDREGKLVKVDFTPPWPRITLQGVIREACGIDIDACNSAGALRQAMKSKGITLEVDTEILGRGSLIDQLYKKVARPSIIQPTFLTGHPLDVSPLARRNDRNPDIVDRFQLVCGGWEIVNAYSELVDALDQSRRFDDQSASSAKGDQEAHRKDDEFVTALAHGCPPCSGWGMGVDRIVALLMQQRNLRDVILFPLMKPMDEGNKSNKGYKGNKEDVRSMTSVVPSLPLQQMEYGHLLPAAHGLLEKHADQTKAHLIATGAAMEALAKHFGGDPATWKVAGMLHDLDWDHLEKDAEEHCGKTLDQMLAEISSPKELLEDIRSHYAAKYGADYPLNTMLRKALYCVDELTGFIIAVALVRPSKKLFDVEVKSVKKKLKEKGFAAQVDRTQIEKCEEMLGIPLDAFIAIVLEAMKPHATEMGL